MWKYLKFSSFRKEEYPQGEVVGIMTGSILLNAFATLQVPSEKVKPNRQEGLMFFLCPFHPFFQPFTPYYIIRARACARGANPCFRNHA